MFRLSQKSQQNGYGLFYLSDTSSTMEDALKLDVLKEQHPVWIVAGRQSSGRGRAGRSWHDYGDNIATTLVLYSDAPIQQLSLLSFVAGLSLVATIKEMAKIQNIDNYGNIKLKWPNDILLNGSKIAGILLETHSKDSGYLVSLGIGVNVGSFPQDMPYPVTSLNDFYKVTFCREDFLEILSDKWVTYFEYFKDTEKHSLLRDEWQENAFGIGDKVITNGQLMTFQGINENFFPILSDNEENITTIFTSEIDWSPAIRDKTQEF